MDRISRRGRLLRRVDSGPFRYLSLSVRTECVIFLAVLAPQVAALAAAGSFSAIGLIAVCAAASAAADLLDAKPNVSDPFFWTDAAIRGILTGFLLPETYPPAMAFLVVLSVMFVNRAVLGGFANSWVNPVAAAVAVAWLVGMGSFPEGGVPQGLLVHRNPSLALVSGGGFPQLPVDAKVTGFLNSALFSRLGVSIPTGYVSLLWDTGSPVPAFRFNLLTLLGSVALFSAGTAGCIVPAVSASLYALLVRLVLPFVTGAPAFQGDVLLAVFSGGFLFGTVFLIQWHGTVPLTNRGKVLYAVSAGILDFILLGGGLSVVGVAFVTLTLNVVSPLIQNLENHYELRHGRAGAAAPASDKGDS